MINSRRIRWMGHSTCKEITNPKIILGGNPKNLFKPMHRSEDNIQMDHKLLRYIGFSWLKIMSLLFNFSIKTVRIPLISRVLYVISEISERLHGVTSHNISLFIVKNSWNVTLILLVLTTISESVMLSLPRALYSLTVCVHNQSKPTPSHKIFCAKYFKRIRILHLAECYWIRKGWYLYFINGNCPFIMRRAVLLTFESHLS